MSYCMQDTYSARLVRKGERKTELYMALETLRERMKIHNPVNIDTAIMYRCGIVPAYLYVSVSAGISDVDALTICRHNELFPDKTLANLDDKEKKILMSIVRKEID